MKKFIFYFADWAGKTQRTEVLASNHGIAISKFKAANAGRILRIEKEKKKNDKVQKEG